MYKKNKPFLEKFKNYLKNSKTKKFILVSSIVISSLIVLLLSGYFIIRSQIIVTLPSIKDIAETTPVSSQVFDRNGNFIASVQLDEYRIAASLNDIPMVVRHAIIASEDERFYKHHGADYLGIIRAAFKIALSGEIVQGGSTITQQLARGLFLTPEQTIVRKLKEIFLAFELEKKYTKDEILEYYMNFIYFGPSPAGRSYGVEAAARNFFGKHVNELTIAEAALVAGTLPAPSDYSPWIDKKIAVENRNEVLYKMKRNNFITKEEYETAINEDADIKSLSGKKLYESKYYFVDYIKQKVLEMFPEDALLKEGLKIYTTLDLDIQDKANESIKEIFDEAEKNKYFKKGLVDKLGVVQPQGQIIVMKPENGEVLAIVGGRDYSNTQFNRCSAARQPGSLFKIFDYTTGLEAGVVGTGTIITSEKLTMPDQEKVWEPEEWVGKNEFFGSLTMREALIKSSNICAVKVAERCGWDRVAYYAEKMGIERKVLPVPSMAIGSIEVKPMEMVTAFGVLANNGERIDPITIRKITTKDDKMLYEFKSNPYRVIKKDTAILMNDVFSSVFANVIGYMPFDAAGKTGTSEDFLSGWFVGYTPDIVVCSWVGRDSAEVDVPYAKLWGSAFAAPIVRRFLNKITPLLPKNKFERKGEEIETVSICRDSGLLATSDCPSDRIVSSSYLRGFSPSVYCTLHREEFIYVTLCEESGLLANEWCTAKIEKAFLKGTEPKNKCNIHKAPLSIHFTFPDIIVDKNSEINFEIGNNSGNVVELFIDNRRVVRITEPPYTYNWIPETEGVHNIMAVLRKDEEYVYMVKLDVKAYK